MADGKKKLPLLPGYNTTFDTRTNFALNQLHDIKNGLPIVKDPNARKEVHSGASALMKQGAAQTEEVVPTTSATEFPCERIPDWVKFDKKVLRYYAFFSEPVFDSPVENERVRKCVLYYYLEDNTIHIEEMREQNSGMPQGRFLERRPVPKSQEEFYGVPDLLVGAVIDIWGRKFTIVDADKSTRNYAKETYGIELKPATEAPLDKWHLQEAAKAAPLGNNSDIATFVESSLGKPMKWQLEKTKKFLANDRKVLQFWCTWDDPALYSEKQEYVLFYFLSDDTIQVSELHQPNSGRDNFPKLLGRIKLPKNPPPVGASKIGQDYSDKVETYTHADLRVGGYVTVYGRHVLLTRADEYTKKFYMEHHGLTEADFEPVVQKAKPAEVPRSEPPPHNGYGTEQDSLGSVYALVPKPPRKNYAKLLKYDKVALRFLGMFTGDNVDPNSKERKFTIEYFLADDSIRVYEQQSRNSGFTAGKFLDRCKSKNDLTGTWFKPDDFFVGATISVNGFLFELKEADEHTLKLMENEMDSFPKSDPNLIMKALAEKFWNSSFSKRKTFREVDTGRDGLIDLEEFKELCMKFGWKLDPHSAITLFRKFDTDNSGSISYREFFAAVEKYALDPTARSNDISEEQPNDANAPEKAAAAAE